MESALHELSSIRLERPPDQITGQQGPVKRVLRVLQRLSELVELGSLNRGWLQSRASCSIQDSNDSAAPVEHTGDLFATCIEHTLLRLIDSNVPRVQVRTAAILLGMATAPSSLLHVARKLYELTKTEANDELFLEPMLLPHMLKMVRRAADPARGLPPEVAVMLTGAIKHATINADTRAAVVAADGAMIIGWLLRSPGLAPAAHTRPVAADHATLIAVQASGVLRNLASTPAHVPALLLADCLRSVCGLLATRGAQPDVALNVARVVSKLSLHPSAQLAIMADGALLRALLRAARAHSGGASKRGLTLRFAFAFGNLCAADRANSATFAAVPGAVDFAAELLHGATAHLGASGHPPSTDTSGDEVLMHAVRWAANLATHEDAGKPLARDTRVAAAVCSILEHRSVEEAEELLLHTANLVSNVSYYMDLFSVAAWDDDRCGNVLLALPPRQVLHPLVPLLVGDNEEGVLEALRALGNFSRLPAAREYTLTSRVDEALVLLLGSGNLATLHAVVGVLVNVCCSAAACARLADVGVGAALVEAVIDVLPLAADAGSCEPGDGARDAAGAGRAGDDVTAGNMNVGLRASRGQQAALLRQTAVVLAKVLANMMSFHAATPSAACHEVGCQPGAAADPSEATAETPERLRTPLGAGRTEACVHATRVREFRFGNDFWSSAVAVVAAIEQVRSGGGWPDEAAGVFSRAEDALLRLMRKFLTDDLLAKSALHHGLAHASDDTHGVRACLMEALPEP